MVWEVTGLPFHVLCEGMCGCYGKSDEVVGGSGRDRKGVRDATWLVYDLTVTCESPYSCV